MKPYRVAVITDLHIDDKEKMNFGIDTKSNLLLLFEDIKKQRIHHLLILGDLCNMDPKIYIYLWIKEQLDKYNFSYNIIPGNHDNTLMIEEVFGIKNPHYSMDEWERKVLFLNTVDNTLPKKQLLWLHEELKDCNKEVFIFMHHPPTLLNCNLMDNNYPLQNIEEVQEVFQNLNRPLTIFCGHYHDNIQMEYKNQMIYLTPSNIFQIDEIQAEFRIKTYNPAWRFLEFKKNTIDTRVHFLDLGREK